MKHPRLCKWGGHTAHEQEESEVEHPQLSLSPSPPGGARYSSTLFASIAIDEAPAWADDLSSIRDIGVLTAIYKEVAEHEATFWGAGTEGL